MLNRKNNCLEKRSIIIMIYDKVNKIHRQLKKSFNKGKRKYKLSHFNVSLLKVIVAKCMVEDKIA